MLLIQVLKHSIGNHPSDSPPSPTWSSMCLSGGADLFTQGSIQFKSFVVWVVLNPVLHYGLLVDRYPILIFSDSYCVKFSDFFAFSRNFIVQKQKTDDCPNRWRSPWWILLGISIRFTILWCGPSKRNPSTVITLISFAFRVRRALYLLTFSFLCIPHFVSLGSVCYLFHIE